MWIKVLPHSDLSRSKGLNQMLEETFHKAMIKADSGTVSRIQRTLDRLSGDCPLHSGSFLSNRDTRRKPPAGNFRHGGEPRFVPRAQLEDFDFMPADASKYEPIFSFQSSPVTKSTNPRSESRVSFPTLSKHTPTSPVAPSPFSPSKLDLRLSERPKYEPAQSSPSPKRTKQPSDSRVSFAPFSPVESTRARVVAMRGLDAPAFEVPLAAKQTPGSRVSFIEPGQDSDSDSFELEAHRQLLDEVGQFIAAHDFDEQEETKVGNRDMARAKAAADADITARMNAFRHRTGSLLENARRTGGESQQRFK
jgi:hypothetical protein